MARERGLDHPARPPFPPGRVSSPAMSAPVIAGYTLGAELGRGANGAVYAASHDATGAPVALKVVTAETERVRDGLHHEVLAMARLNHPNLLFLLDAGVVEGAGGAPPTVWMALERASGGSLLGWAPSGWDAVVDVLDPLLAGLAHAHARGVLHRDLKPANLLIATASDPRPGLKIADFGLTSVRGVGTVFRRGGTPNYMPPEQTATDRGEPGPWSDVYALGAMVWLWVTGAPPFEGTPAQVMRAHQSAPVPTLRSTFSVPPALAPMLARMLAKAPGARPSVAEIREGLCRRAPSVAAAFGRADAASAKVPGLGAELLPLRDWRLMGRREERARLLGALEAVVRDRRPAVVLLCGEEGFGATRLMRWVAETADESGVARLVWAPTEAGAVLAQAAHGPVVACFDDLDAASEALMTSLAFAPWPVLVVATCRALQDWPDLDLLPRFERLLVGPMDPSSFRDFLSDELGLTRATAVFMGAACGFRPGVATAWLARLSREGALRPTPDGYEVDAQALARPPAASASPELARWLGPKASTGLRLAALLGDVVSADTLRETLFLAGCPAPQAELEQLARAGLVVPDPRGFRWVSPDPAARLAPPATVEERRLVAAALAADPSPDARLARARHLLAAGDEAAARGLLLVHDPSLTADALERSREAVRLAEPIMDGAGPAERATFAWMQVWVLLKLAGSDQALPAALALADWLAAPVDGVPDALRGGALRLAALVLVFERHFERGLALLAPWPDHPDTLRVRGVAAAAQGDFDESVRLQEAALARADDDATLGRLANGLGTAHGQAGRYDTAISWFRLAAERADEVSRHVSLQNIAISQILLGRYADALDTLHAAARLPRLGGASMGQGVQLMAVAAALTGRDDEVERIGDHALHLLRRRSKKLGLLPSLREVIAAGRPQGKASQAFLAAAVDALGG
jgi:tetratricopeptide (TPR) repeat protein